MPDLSSPVPQNPAVLEARNLVRRSETGAVLLNDVSCFVHAGERWAVSGPSGAGKTLLLRALALLDPVESGEILWDGKLIGRDEIPNYRRSVIYLHQSPSLVEGTVEENFRLPFRFAVNREQSYSHENALRFLQTVNRSADFLKRKAHQLSGGERQLVAIIRGLLLSPRVLLLDEPTAALDADTAQTVEQLILDDFEEQATARCFLWVTHNREQIPRISNRVLEIPLMQSAKQHAE